MGRAEEVIFFDMILIILLSSYGFSTGLVSINTLTSIGSPPYTAPPSTLSPAVVKACGNIVTYFTSILSVTCIAYEIGQLSGGGGNTTNNNVAVAIFDAGEAIYQIPALIGWLITVFVAFANIMLAITFAPALSANGVPALGFVWLGLQIYVLFEVFRMFRGSSSGV